MLIELIQLLIKKYPKKFLPQADITRSQRKNGLPPMAPTSNSILIADSISTDFAEVVGSPLSSMDCSLATESIPEDDGLSVGSNLVSLTSTSTITHEETNSLSSMPARLYPGYVTYNISHKYGDFAFGRGSVSSVASDGKLSRNHKRRSHRLVRKAVHMLAPLPQYLNSPRSQQLSIAPRTLDIGVLGQSFHMNAH